MKKYSHMVFVVALTPLLPGKLYSRYPGRKRRPLFIHITDGRQH